ncbi:mycelial catalase cat1 [Moniliophthora roreri]|nr:mycelial catalase cat1 [Moniliophthora roreri]
MRRLHLLVVNFTLIVLALCADNQGNLPGDDGYLKQFVVDDSSSFTTTDSGTPVDDTHSLKASQTGPTLLEDFVLRTKITRFDHSNIPERIVHARGAAAHGYFESYGDWSNLTAAAFLSKPGKQTSIFVRFSTVAGSRGSADTVRDVHGFALRFYTEEGNYDIVGNNIPVFFIQDAIQFPDLIQAVKPRPDNEIPQAATAHDSAYDFFSQNPSTLHTLLWAMSGHGIPRSYRHMDGFGVHTFRFVTRHGKSKLVKFHFKSQQGLASLIWPEALIISGQNPDFHRQDLFNAIEAGHFPEWELGVQIMDEEDVLKYGFDLRDPTKIVPETLVPVTPLGKFVLNRNPMNYFAETEQLMLSPGNVVPGIDFSDDTLLQGRLFSYVDTQLNRNMGSPNFDQLPINRCRFGVHNNNRNGAGQQFIHSNIYPYTPNTLNHGFPKPANQTVGNGFFTAPARRITDGRYVREMSPTFSDHWSQPRLFWNSNSPDEQQMIVSALRFELARVQSVDVRRNFITQLNRVDNDLAKRVASAINIEAPAPDPQYYHKNTTINLSVFNTTLKTIAGLNVGILATNLNGSTASVEQAVAIAQAFRAKGVHGVVIAETLGTGVDATYIGSDGTLFDGVIVCDHTDNLYDAAEASFTSWYPSARPMTIVRVAYTYGKPVGAIGGGKQALDKVFTGRSVIGRKGVYVADDVGKLVNAFEEGLKVFKFLDRFPKDH